MSHLEIGSVNYSWIDTYTHYYRFYIRQSEDGRGDVSSIIKYLKILTDLLKEGYLNDFRIGTSMFSLILSRSIKHHLRSDQKMIKIYLTKDEELLSHNLNSTLVKENIQYTGIEYIRSYLDELKRFPFD
ncbi:MAG: hypothetical protein AAGA31_05865 [Bacteroidota bacterium]